ncbi:VOC family protein [Marinobacter halodurans]|uniref:VOC family protein n=1 Tax=Marinobacter halodurans TaxID=2528979 RepID=A0ABY1ZNA9_9GAMM|nr:VOC family protein [Marinobacter halodurans]TBW57970.1 VOC family protein [Marinobacter halodurans]
MNPRMSMVTLGVANLQLSIAFYRDGLGFPQLDSPPSVAFFTLNGTWLGLYGRDALAEDVGVPASTPAGFPGFTIAHNLPSEVDVDRVMAEAVAAGATLIKSPQKVFWGGYSGYFEDPDGYLWELAHNPFFWIGPPDSASG